MDGVPATRNHLPDWDFRTDPAGNPVVYDGLHRAGHDAGVNDVLAPSCGRRPSRPPARSRGNTRLGCRLGGAGAGLAESPATRCASVALLGALSCRCPSVWPIQASGLRRIAAATAQRGAVARKGVLPRASVRIVVRQRSDDTSSQRARPTGSAVQGRSALLEIFPVVPWIGNLNVAARSLTQGSSTSPSATRPPAPTSRSSLGASQTQNGGNSSPNSRACAASG